MKYKLAILGLLFCVAFVIGFLAISSKGKRSFDGEIKQILAIAAGAGPDKALEITDQQVAIARRKFASQPEALATVFGGLASMYVRINQLEKAESILIEAITITESASVLSAGIKARRALQDLYLRRRDIEKASESFKAINALYLESPRRSDPKASYQQTYFDLSIELFNWLLALRRPLQAKLVLDSIQKQLELNAGLEKSAMYSFINGKGKLSLAQGDPKAAISTLESLLALRTKEKASDVAGDVAVYKSIAAIYCETKDPTPAVQWVNRAITAYKKAGDPDSLPSAGVRMEIATCFSKHGLYDFAEEQFKSYFEECQACRTKRPDQYILALALRGAITLQLGRKPQGTTILKTAYDQAKGRYGEKSWISRQISSALNGQPNDLLKSSERPSS